MVGVDFLQLKTKKKRKNRKRRKNNNKDERDTPLMFEDAEGHKIYAVYNV